MELGNKDIYEQMISDLRNKENKKERASYLRDMINATRLSNNIHINRSNILLMYLWEVFRESLWTEILENNLQYHNFRDWVDGEIAPTFNKRNDDREPAESMIQDIVRVVERTLPYAMQNAPTDANGIPITPSRLIDEVGFKKLKETSSRFLDNINNNERNNTLKKLMAT